MDLAESIRARIRARGPITFAEFMELALYDPDRGFFSGTPVGSHFITSPQVSLLFASLLAVQCKEALRPGDTLVDLGAADGALLEAIRRLVDARGVAVEQGWAARAAASARGLETAATVEELERFSGVAIANELFDNIPFHVFRPGPVEVCVGLAGDDLVEVETAPTIDPGPERDGPWTVSPRAHRIVASIAQRLERGYVIVIDYGYVAGETPEPVRGYRAHRLERDVLTDPGSMDITGPVDMDALAGAARSAGLDTFGPVRQADALRALGFAEAMDRLRRAQLDHEANGRARQAIAMLGARNDAASLVDPAGLGSHYVLVLATPGSTAPRLVRGSEPEKG